MTEAEIKDMIEAGLPGSEVSISGDGRHFEAIVVHPDFAGKPMLAQHRMVYAALGDNFQKDNIHALSFKTLTPEQWADSSNS